jgi:hypothetical protein
MKDQLHIPDAYFWENSLILSVWKAVWAVGLDSKQMRNICDTARETHFAARRTSSVF